MLYTNFIDGAFLQYILGTIHEGGAEKINISTQVKFLLSEFSEIELC